MTIASFQNCCNIPVALIYNGLQIRSEKLCTYYSFSPCLLLPLFVGLALVGKDIVVFRFIIEYSSLRDFGPY
jgi:hypothetical protein